MANNIGILLEKSSGKETDGLNLLDLPTVLLMDIFELLPYDTVAKNRQVCRDFDDIGGKVLNAGFNKVIRRHSAASKLIKTQLPRRESERRNHYLARHSDVLSSIETRISMLSLTYGKYIDMNLCCFIPGRVLDEINKVLDMIGSTNRTLRPHEVLQELRDISSMAIEHFDEFIVINIKKTYTDNFKFNDSSVGLENNSITLRNELANISQDTERFQDMESATKELYQRLVFGPSLRNKFITNKNNNSNVSTDGSNKPLATLEDALANLKKIEKTQSEMQKQLNKISFSDKGRNRQLSVMNVLTSDLSQKITSMQKRIKELESKNRELHATIKRITESDDNEESFKGDKLKTSTTTTTTTTESTGTATTMSNEASTSGCPYNKPSCSSVNINILLEKEYAGIPTLHSHIENPTDEDLSDELPLAVLSGRKRTKSNDNVGPKTKKLKKKKCKR